MKQLVVPALAAVALLLAMPAHAKGPITLVICGSSECRTFDWTPAKREHQELVTGVVALFDSFDFVSVPPLAPYYVLKLEADWYEWDSAFYVAEHGVAEVQSSWLPVRGRLAGSLRAATAGLAPHPRPALERVVVNGHIAKDPAAYAAIFDDLPEVEAPTPDVARARIRIGGSPNPWTDDGQPIAYFPSVDVLHREAEWVRAPGELAESIELDLRAGAAARRARWPSYLSLFALIAGAGGLAWLRMGRRRARARVP